MLKSVKEEKPEHARIDRRVAQFIMMRDKLEAIEEEYKAKRKPYQDAKDKVEGDLLEIMAEAGLKSVKTVEGTATIKVTPYASCSDPDLFIEYVRENDAYELMDRRANATACLGFAEEHDGQLPPGVKLTRKRTIGVTRA